MTLHFLEGFGGYATGAHTLAAGADLLLNFAQWSTPLTLTSFASGSQGNRKYLTCPTSAPNLLLPNLPSTTTTMIVGFRYRNTSGVGHRIIDFEADSDWIGGVGVNGEGRPAYTTHWAGRIDVPNALFTSTRSIPKGTWGYVECKIVFGNTTAGSVDFWINGTAAGSISGVDTSYDNEIACQRIRIGRTSSYDNWSPETSVTDFYVDTSTVRGPMEVWYQAADTAGSASNFTPLSDTNEEMVDDIGSDGDTTYNESTATGTKDQIAHGDSLDNAPLAIQPLAMARYVSPGSGTLQVGILSGATEDLCTARGLADEYNGCRGSIYEVDPNTSSAWTASNADAAETVYKHYS